MFTALSYTHEICLDNWVNVNIKFLNGQTKFFLRKAELLKIWCLYSEVLCYGFKFLFSFWQFTNDLIVQWEENNVRLYSQRASLDSVDRCQRGNIKSAVDENKSYLTGNKIW